MKHCVLLSLFVFVLSPLLASCCRRKMEEVYDYSRHRYCIAIDLGYDIIVSKAIAINGTKKNERYNEYRTSILYDTTTRNIIARGNKADEANENSKGLQKGVIYVRNKLSKLTDHYLGAKQSPFLNTALYEEAIDLLQKILYDCKQELKSENMDFYYSLNLPTSWDYKIRKEFFLPLFIKAGLLHENDGPGRLVIFSMLELNFQNMQMETGLYYGLQLKHSDQRVICTIDYQGTYSVDLKLVSAQYPAFRLAQRKLEPQLLKQAHFLIPFGLKELRLSLIASVEKHCDTTLSSESVGNMLEKLSQGYKGFKNFEYIGDVLDDQPFPDLKSRWTNKPIILEDILEHFSGIVEKFFRNEVDKFLVGRSNIGPRPLDIFYTSRIPKTFLATGLISSVDCWSKMYFMELRESYAPVELGGDFPIFKLFDYRVRGDAIVQLLSNRIGESNMRRNPVMLFNETTIEQPKSCSQPIIFINIDISLTQIETAITYMNEDRHVEQKRNFSFGNMQPLDKFITESELYQRPILQINNRVKLDIETLYGHFLEVYPNRINQSTTVKEWMEKVRDLMVSWIPNLLETLTTIAEIGDLFTLSNEQCDDGGGLVSTSHPAYMFFFMITYFYSYKKLLEEVLGNNAQGKNIWYGVSIDKNLLDTVFGSTKKLENLFFLSGILQKDDNLRQAKFCVRGEEVLPAIQQKLVDLEFKIKSYFVVAQVSSKHIQLTLHQVVKLALPGEDGASIVVQDKIIYIDDVYGGLCKKIIRNIQANGQVDYCTKHRDEKNTRCDFESFETYNYINQKLKPCVVQMLRMNEANVDMESRLRLNISGNCACSIDIFLRNIIEIGLMSVIRNIVSDITASLTNKGLFGNYEPNYIFVFGDPFNLIYNSTIHTAYTTMMQRVLDDGIEFKQKDTKMFVLHDQISRLLGPLNPLKRPYLFERFVTGTLCQVSSETYALRIMDLSRKFFLPFVRVNRHGDTRNTIEGNGSYIIFIQKGEKYSPTGFKIRFTGEYGYANTDILQSNDSSGSVPKKYALLDSDAEGSVYEIGSNSQNSNAESVIIECKYINHNYSLKLSTRKMGRDAEYTKNPSINQFLRINQPLTLAYF